MKYSNYLFFVLLILFSLTTTKRPSSIKIETISLNVDFDQVSFVQIKTKETKNTEEKAKLKNPIKNHINKKYCL